MPKTTPATQPTATNQPPIIAPNTTWEVTLKWSDVKPAYDKAVKTLAKNVKSPGFRAGKVPPHIAAPLIGHDALVERAVNELLPALYEADIKKHKRQPLTRPSVGIKSAVLGQDWIVEIAIAEKPVISVKGYEKIVKKSLAEGDKAWHDHLKEHDKEEKTQGKTAKNDKADPAKAKPATGEHDHSEEHHRQQLLQGAYRALVLEFKPQVPELLLKEETQAELEYLVRQLRELKMTLDEYLQRRQIKFEQLSNDLALEVLGRIQLEWVLDAIQQDAKITAAEKDRQKYFDQIEDPKNREKWSQDPQYLAYIDRLSARDKVTHHLLSLQ